MFNKTTKTISLVLISSALVFIGWGTPGCCISDQNYGDGSPPHYSSSFWWFSSSHTTTYSNGLGGGTGVSSSGSTSGGRSHSSVGSVSSRGGFGSSGTGVGA